MSGKHTPIQSAADLLSETAAERDRLRTSLHDVADRAAVQVNALRQDNDRLRAEVERLTEELNYEKIGDNHHQEQYAELRAEVERLKQSALGSIYAEIMATLDSLRAEKAELVALVRQLAEAIDEAGAHEMARAALAKATAMEGGE